MSENFIISDFNFVSDFISNKIIDRVLDGKKEPKKTFQHHFIGNSMKDLFYIIDEINPSMICVLTMAFLVIFLTL